jgi:type IV pilus assembly protein PilF
MHSSERKNACAGVDGASLNGLDICSVRSKTLATSVLSVVVAACGAPNSGSGGAQSPERQSIAEYDVARDLLGKGQNRAALDHAQKAVELDEENAKALFLMSAILGSFCNQDAGLRGPDCNVVRAEEYARKAVKADGQFREAKNLLTQILIWEQKYDEAVRTIEPLTRDPAYIEAHLAWGNMGWALTLSGQIDRGIEALRNAVALQPKFCVGHFRLSVAEERKGDLAGAEASLTRALEVEAVECKNLQDAWEARGRIRAKLGRNEEAKADYLKCKEVAPYTKLGKACMVALR